MEVRTSGTSPEAKKPVGGSALIDAPILNRGVSVSGLAGVGGGCDC